MNKIIYILGNSLVKKDSIITNILPKLQKIFPDIVFIHFDPTENIEFSNINTLIIIDATENIKNVTIFDSLEYFELSPRFSVHDYDLSLDLNILKKLDKLKNIYIIGVPPDLEFNIALKEVSHKIRSISL
jgi:hypothetical protein